MSKRKLDAQNQPSSSPSSSNQPPTPALFTSNSIHDRSSTFTAIFTPSTTNPRTLQSHAPFKTASHRILAWRKPSTQRSLAPVSTGVAPKPIYETGSDDDGEKYAGKKLEKVLVEMDVQGTVVVARWYGGVLLGPVRFKWIEDVAREAVGLWKASLRGEEGRDGKRVKGDGIGGIDDGVGGVVDEVKQKEKAVNVLKERDASVGVLRALLAEKNAELLKLEGKGGKEVDAGHKTESDKQGEVPKSPSTVALDYSSMPLQTLKRLEKARDATLSWILKQIDLAEEKIRSTKGVKDDT